MKDLACSDCVVTMLLGPIDGSVSEHHDVFEVLANAKLTAPLRLITGGSQDEQRHSAIS